jgi:hypothetical protein
MRDIPTRQKRRQRSSMLMEEICIECTYIDHPASLYTWFFNCGVIAREMQLTASQVHRRLFAQTTGIFHIMRKFGWV